MTCHIEQGELVGSDGITRVELRLYHLYDKCPKCGPNYDPNRVAKAVAKALGLCGKGLECGGLCYLKSGHDLFCLCIGDENGVPDTCPA